MDSHKPSFRNTRSRFFKKQSDEDFSHNTSSSSAEQNTGAYWKNLGNQAFKNGNLDLAVQHYSKAIDINGSESIFFSNRAKCYQLLNKYDLALKDAEEACELDDMNLKAHHHCGCILAELSKTNPQKLPKAENRLKKALRLCKTLGKEQFEDEVSIKLFRLNKLKYFLKEIEEQKFIKLQKQLIKDSFHEGILEKNYYESMLQAHQKMHVKKIKQIPDYMLCKITLELMEDPVTTDAGFTYEKQAILDHLRRNGAVEPITRKPFSANLYPNHSLKAAINDFLEKNPWAF